MTTNTWTIDPTHSNISFSIRHMVFSKVRGGFSDWSGSIELDPDDLTGSQIEATIRAASIDTATAARDEHLRSADFLDVENHPELRFRSTSIEKLSDVRYQVQGALTIRDVSREVTLDVEVAGQGQDPWGNQRMGFSASASILRSNFGLTWNQALEAGGVLVGDKIDLSFEIQAVQAAATEAA